MAKKPNNFVGIGGADGSIITSVPKDFKSTGGAGIGTPTISAGFGAGTTETTKGEDFNPDEPDVPGTFGKTPGGNPNAVTRGGRTYFIQGSDLELFQQQQDAKDALSGGVTQGLNPRNTIAQNQQIAAQQVAQAAIVPGEVPNLAAPGGIPAAFVKGTFAGLSEEEIVRLGLTPLDLEVLQSGEAEISNLGRAAESIPIIGRTGIRIAGTRLRLSDFFETPSKKVDELIALIKANSELAEVKLQYARGNPALARHYKDQIEELYQMNLRLQSRVKLLSIQSPAIQGNPDEILRLNGEIETANDKYADILVQMVIF